ncbi:MAG: GspH/FimT family pseudopilin [Alphaproteobacteria bacterium]
MSRGFTLIELLVVMAILALVLVVVPPMFSGSLSTATLRGAARDVAAGLRRARSEAITLNQEIGFRLDLEAHSYTIGDGQTSLSLPSDVELALFTAASERLDETTGAIRFFPDGSSTGGGITLVDEDRKFEVIVDWLTGKVTIVD